MAKPIKLFKYEHLGKLGFSYLLAYGSSPVLDASEMFYVHYNNAKRGKKLMKEFEGKLRGKKKYSDGFDCAEQPPIDGLRCYIHFDDDTDSHYNYKYYRHYHISFSVDRPKMILTEQQLADLSAYVNDLCADIECAGDDLNRKADSKDALFDVEEFPY